MGVELNKILFDQRIPLLKKYVYVNKNNIVAALLPNFCTLQNVLRKEDYFEMYQSLAEKMKQTDYGKSVYERSK